MIRRSSRTEDGVTGLELVILVLVLIAGGALLLMHMGSAAPSPARTFPGGMISESMYMSGDHIQTVGSVFGSPMTSRSSGTLPVIITREDPGRLGIVQVTVSLFIGSTGAIDMDRVETRWTRAGSSEIIPRVATPVLVCPNWTISGKYNLLPGRTADSDDWLEPNEQFELTVCPSEGARPYDTFALTLQPDGIAMPLVVSRIVPANIRPVMNLG